MTTATTSRPITEQEYLQMEEKSEVRHELINGKLYEMPGGSMFHEEVIANIQYLLKRAGLKVLAQGLRVRPPETQDYYYPDVVVTAEKSAKVYYSQVPLLLAEVLSPSTRVTDLADKFIAYRRFPSLHYYLLAEPDFCQVTLLYKNDSGEWESEIYRQLSEIISLEKLSVQLPLADIYAGIEWADKA